MDAYPHDINKALRECRFILKLKPSPNKIAMITDQRGMLWDSMQFRDEDTRIDMIKLFCTEDLLKAITGTFHYIEAVYTGRREWEILYIKRLTPTYILEEWDKDILNKKKNLNHG